MKKIDIANGKLAEAQANVRKAYAEKIIELKCQKIELKKLLQQSNNWVKAFYAYEKSNFVRRKVAAHIKEVEKILREEENDRI